MIWTKVVLNLLFKKKNMHPLFLKYFPHSYLGTGGGSGTNQLAKKRTIKLCGAVVTRI